MTDHRRCLNNLFEAIRSGTQTQFRQPLDPQPPKDAELLPIACTERDVVFSQAHLGLKPPEFHAQLPYQIGDRILVLEDCAISNEPDPKVVYQNDDFSDKAWFYETTSGPEWTSYIWAGMPRWASRLTLVVTNARVQRLQEISEADAVAEGVTCRALTESGFAFGRRIGPRLEDPRDSFRTLWNATYGPEAWDQNSWVVATTFTTHHCNIDKMGEA